jgi:hypothetical protein
VKAEATPAAATAPNPPQGKETGVDRWFEALGGEDERGSVTPPERAASEVTRSVADGIVRSVRDALVSRPWVGTSGAAGGSVIQHEA